MHDSSSSAKSLEENFKAIKLTKYSKTKSSYYHVDNEIDLANTR